MDIRIDALHFTYPAGVTALRGVTLVLRPGESVALIGENGAGKTTLARHLNGLLRPTSGSVRVGGWDTRQRTPAQLAARVGYVFQNPDDQLFQASVHAEVMFGPKNLGWPSDRAEAAARTAIEAVGLGALAGRHPYDLVLGLRKRVALAAVLAMNTPIVVLDEPTGGQDAAGVEMIGRRLSELRAHGRTVIAITHDLDFCAEHFERVVVLSQGQVLLDGPAREVLARAEVLSQAQIDPPQMIRLAAALGLAGRPLTVGEFVSAVRGG